MADYDPNGGGTLRRVDSLDSVLPPPLMHKKRVRFLLAILVPTTLAMMVICCMYSDLQGHSAYW